jgi:hypothetical protein
MLGAATTVNVFPLLATPETVTTTLPVVAPLGTTTTTLVLLQLVYVATAVPLNLTVLVPRVEPKPLPVIVTDAPIAPEVGERLVIFGAAKAKLADKISTERTTAEIEGRIIALPPDVEIYSTQVKSASTATVSAGKARTDPNVCRRTPSMTSAEDCEYLVTWITRSIMMCLAR